MHRARVTSGNVKASASHHPLLSVAESALSKTTRRRHVVGKMAPPRETRRERQQFMERLKGRSSAERARIQKEHTAFLAGERDMDADYGEDPGSVTLPAAPQSRTPSLLAPRPPIGKDASYLRAQRKLLSQQRRAVAAKTLAGSGKKRLVVRRDASDDDDDYMPELDGGSHDSDEPLDDGAVVRKKKAASKRLGPKKKKTKVTPMITKKLPKKPRKPSAVRLAKDKEMEARKAAAELRCEATEDAEEAGSMALQEARKRLEEIAKDKATKKKKKRENTTRTKRNCNRVTRTSGYTTCNSNSCANC
eukprot:jgi/Phyca11/112136/e_gw1.21.542.1